MAFSSATAHYLPALMFGAITALSVFLISSCGRVILDDEGVTHRNVFGVYRIAWAECRKIELAPGADKFGISKGSLVLHGEQKRFVLPSPVGWSGPHSIQAQAFLAKKVAETGLTPVFIRIAMLKSHKNVRVSSVTSNPPRVDGR